VSDLLLQIKPGQLAALGTAMCWTIGILCFEYSSKKVGSQKSRLIVSEHDKDVSGFCDVCNIRMDLSG